MSALHKAALGALCLHLLLLAIFPAIPQWNLIVPTKGVWLNVLLEKPSQKPFDQRLNAANNQADSITTQVSRLDAAKPTEGKDKVQSQASEEVAGVNNDATVSQAVGQNATNAVAPPLVFSHASVVRFSQQEAVRYADQAPDELARFTRSFHSRKRYPRRKQISSYKNRYGDQYIRSNTSNGDICFVKFADKSVSRPKNAAAATYTVHFFRCEDKDIKLTQG